MQIGADQISLMNALEAVFAVVAERGTENAAERTCARTQRGASAMVLEPDDGHRADVALNSCIAD